MTIAHLDERDAYDELAAYVKAIKKRVAKKPKRPSAKKPGPSEKEPMERMTKDLLSTVAEGLVHERRTRHGADGSDGTRRPAPERGGLGLYDAGTRRHLLAEQAPKKKLQCDMDTSCAAPVSHIDDDGYVYCAAHGARRKATRPCRKLRPGEIKKLEAGGTTSY